MPRTVHATAVAQAHARADLPKGALLSSHRWVRQSRHSVVLHDGKRLRSAPSSAESSFQDEDVPIPPPDTPAIAVLSPPEPLLPIVVLSAPLKEQAAHIFTNMFLRFVRQTSEVGHQRETARSFFIFTSSDWATHLRDVSKSHEGFASRIASNWTLWMHDDSDRWMPAFSPPRITPSSSFSTSSSSSSSQESQLETIWSCEDDASWQRALCKPDVHMAIMRMVLHLQTSNEWCDPCLWLVALTLLRRLAKMQQEQHSPRFRFYRGHVFRNLYALFALAWKCVSDWYIKLSDTWGCLPQRVIALPPDAPVNSRTALSDGSLIAASGLPRGLTDRFPNVALRVARSMAADRARLGGPAISSPTFSLKHAAELESMIWSMGLDHQTHINADEAMETVSALTDRFSGEDGVILAFIASGSTNAWLTSS